MKAPSSLGSSPLRSGGEVARATPEAERGDLPSRRSPKNVARARNLRRGDNMAEALLWDELKAKKLGGYKFVRQMPLGPYYADFACRTHRLVVELDGSQHSGSRHDRVRDEFMRAQGYSVLRLWSHDVIKNMRAACETILAALQGQLAEDVVSVDLRFVLATGSGEPQ